MLSFLVREREKGVTLHDKSVEVDALEWAWA